MLVPSVGRNVNIMFGHFFSARSDRKVLNLFLGLKMFSVLSFYHGKSPFGE